VTKSVDPRELATWTLSELHTRLSEYLFEVYDTIDHPALGLSPREAFQAGFEASGIRTERMIPYDQEFLMATLPATPKGTAKVTPGRGVSSTIITIGPAASSLRWWRISRFRSGTIRSTPARPSDSSSGDGCDTAAGSYRRNARLRG
jgi:hypothetical protein